MTAAVKLVTLCIGVMSEIGNEKYKSNQEQNPSETAVTF